MVKLDVISVFACFQLVHSELDVWRSSIVEQYSWLARPEVQIRHTTAYDSFLIIGRWIEDWMTAYDTLPRNEAFGSIQTRHISFEGIMQSIVSDGQPSVSRRPIKHESSGFSFLLHLLPDACQPTNLLVSSLAAIIIDPRTIHTRVDVIVPSTVCESRICSLKMRY